MSAPVFLFFGYGSEYSLHPLLKFMSACGDSCVEIDMLHEENLISRLQDLAGKSIVFVTSAHLLYDSRNFFYYRTSRAVVSALHVISTLQPAISVYYPHDYKDPVKPEEVSYLSLFDLVLWPFAELDDSIATLVKVQPVGWIKNVPASKASAVENPSGAVFFIGAFQFYLNAGVEAFYDDFRELFEAGVALKLPVWHDTAAFEAYLAQRDVIIYPSDSNSIDVMRANDVIFTHALSSVCLEACHLGKSVIYIKNSTFDYLDPIASYADSGNIAFVESPRDAVALIGGKLPVNTPTMQPFDFPLARDAIWAEYRAKVQS